MSHFVLGRGNHGEKTIKLLFEYRKILLSFFPSRIIPEFSANCTQEIDIDR